MILTFQMNHVTWYILELTWFMARISWFLLEMTHMMSGLTHWIALLICMMRQLIHCIDNHILHVSSLNHIAGSLNHSIRSPLDFARNH